jgi:hypothetical protein
LFPREQSIQQIRFNGDRAAFVRGNLLEFIALLEAENVRSGNVVWMNDNIMACSSEMWNYLSKAPYWNRTDFWDSFEEQYCFKFDREEMLFMCLREPKASDVPVFDMILESLGQQGVSDLVIRKRVMYHPDEHSRQHIFSSDVLRQFLVGNDMLKNLTLTNFWIDEDQSDIIGRYSRGLDSINICDGYFEIEHFANGIGANDYEPNKIILRDCSMVYEDDVFSSFIGPLLSNLRLKILHLLSPQKRVRLCRKYWRLGSNQVCISVELEP